MSDSSDTALAFDVGGTKVTAGVVGSDGRIHIQATMPTHASPDAEPNGADPAAVLLRRMARLAHEVLATHPDAAPRRAAVATTGHVDARRGVILHSGLVKGWSGLPLSERLGTLIGLPVQVRNDGHAMAVAEHRLGAAQGCDHALCVAVGTGVGGGFIQDGHLYLGGRGLAGLIGHSTIAFNGRRCQCGKRGCLEAYAAGPRIVDEYHRLVRVRPRRDGHGAAASPTGGAGGAQTLQDVAQLAHQGDAIAGEALERGGRYLGVGLASLANALNPQVIVVGGGVLGAGERWLNAVRQTVFERTRHTVAEGLQVVPAALGPQAVLVGAGLIALER